MTDAIDTAVAAAPAHRQEFDTLTITLKSGRMVRANVPARMTDDEMFDLLSILAVQIRPKIRAAVEAVEEAERAARSAGSIALPNGSLRLVPKASA